MAKAKEQFAKILDNFTAKTKETMSKFNGLLTEARTLGLEAEGERGLQQKAENTRQSLESMLKELDEVRNLKKIKLA